MLAFFDEITGKSDFSRFFDGISPETTLIILAYSEDLCYNYHVYLYVIL